MTVVPMNATLCTPDCPGSACPRCHGQRWYVSAAAKAQGNKDRDAWIRAFNRLEAAISHHKRDEGFPDVHDEALYHARDRILSDLQP